MFEPLATSPARPRLPPPRRRARPRAAHACRPASAPPELDHVLAHLAALEFNRLLGHGLVAADLAISTSPSRNTSKTPVLGRRRRWNPRANGLVLEPDGSRLLSLGTTVASVRCSGTSEYAGDVIAGRLGFDRDQPVRRVGVGHDALQVLKAGDGLKVRRRAAFDSLPGARAVSAPPPSRSLASIVSSFPASAGASEAMASALPGYLISGGECMPPAGSPAPGAGSWRSAGGP